MPLKLTAWLFLSLLMLPLNQALSAGADGIDQEGLTERLQACAACHGEYGRSGQEVYYPSIAGKPAGYLYQQLLNFREGRRLHAIMRQMLAQLSDSYLQEIAGYYAAQRPSISARESEFAGQLSGPQLAAGRRLVEQGDPARDIPACVDCHGSTLKGIAPSVPGLVGLPAEYLSAQLGAWRTGTRHAPAPDCMAQIAKALRGDEIMAITAWIASQPVQGDYRPDAGPPGELPMPCGAVQ